MFLKKIAPADLVTLANAILGFLAMLYLFDGGKRAFAIAGVLIFLAMLADGLDGFVARHTKSKHDLGVYFDSISDTVSFCFGPAIFIYAIFYDVDRGSALFLEDGKNVLAIIASFSVFLLGVIRLAQFSVLKEDQLPYFEGLATPALTYFVVILIMCFRDIQDPFDADYLLLIIIIVLSGLMLSEFKFPKIRGKFVHVSLVALTTGIIGSYVMFYDGQNDTQFRVIPLGISLLLILLYLASPILGICQEDEGKKEGEDKKEENKAVEGN